jgi:hypothetical protein
MVELPPRDDASDNMANAESLGPGRSQVNNDEVQPTVQSPEPGEFDGQGAGMTDVVSDENLDGDHDEDAPLHFCAVTFWVLVHHQVLLCVIWEVEVACGQC